MALFPTKIVVATDASEEAQLAARASVEVADRTGSELHIVHTWSSETRPHPGATWEGFSLPTETIEELEKQARKLLEDQARKMEETGGTVAEAHLRMGKPVEEIVNLCEEIGAGLVMVGSRGHSGIERLVLGSVSEGVVRYAASPVFVVRRGGFEAFPGTILLATDGSAESTLAAEAAAEFCSKFDSELHVVHVGHEVPVTHFESEVRAHFEEEAQNVLSGEVKRIEEAGGRVAQTHLKMGPSVEEIVNLAEELKVGAVMVGSRGLGTIKRVVMGSVSESVVRHAHCSVMVVRREEEGQDE